MLTSTFNSVVNNVTGTVSWITESYEKDYNENSWTRDFSAQEATCMHLLLSLKLYRTTFIHVHVAYLLQCLK